MATQSPSQPAVPTAPPISSPAADSVRPSASPGASLGAGSGSEESEAHLIPSGSAQLQELGATADLASTQFGGLRLSGPLERLPVD